MMKIVLVIIGVITLIVLGISIYYGAFSGVTCRIEKQGGEIIVYKQMKGDYSQSAKAIDEVYYSLLNEYELETYKGFGIYYDNPQKVEKSELRSEMGCIIEEKDGDEIVKLMNKFDIKIFPEKSYVVTEFPNKGQLSVLFGLMRVYPALTKFSKLKGLKEDGFVMEIYDVPNKKIIYRKEIVE